MRWIAEMHRLPGRLRQGLLTSGGNMANFVGFLAARAREGAVGRPREGAVAAGRPAPARLRLRRDAHLDPEGGRPLRARHRRDPLDRDRRRDQRMDVAAPAPADRARIARAGRLPFLVVGTAGTVSTGAVDPLAASPRICREEDLWFHVDGAYGGFAAGVAGRAGGLCAGIALADSVAVDPHKWLYAPLEAGCALVRDRDALRDAVRVSPALLPLRNREATRTSSTTTTTARRTRAASGR